MSQVTRLLSSFVVLLIVVLVAIPMLAMSFLVDSVYTSQNAIIDEPDPIEITFNANGGYFADGETERTVEIVEPSTYEHITEIRTTDNFADVENGSSAAGYGVHSNGKNQVVTIPGAEKLKVTITYQTYGTSYAWVSLYDGNTTPSKTNYASSISGKLGSSTKKTQTFEIEGDTVQIFFVNTASSSTAYQKYYGFYAVVEADSGEFAVTEPEYEIPAREGKVLAGWATSPDSDEALNDWGRFDKNVTLYAVWEDPIKKTYAVQTKNTSDTGTTLSFDSFLEGQEPKVGETYLVDGEDCEITGAWYGGDIYTDGWETAKVSSWTKSSITNVRILTEIKPVSTANWFNGCSKLVSLNLANLNTSNVTDMSSMFYNCKALTSLSIPSFDTSKVINMSSMFYYCQKLTELDLSSFNTSNTTNMSSMFYYCQNLISIDGISSWGTSKVTNMSKMFYYCQGFSELDLSGWDTSKVTNIESMFYYCNNLKMIFVSDKWSTAKVTSSDKAFTNCSMIFGGNHSNIYSSSKVDKTYACIGLDKNNGYLTPKTYIQYHDADGNEIGEPEQYRYNTPAKNALDGYFGWKTSYKTFRPKETLVYDFDKPFTQIDLYPATEDEFTTTSYAALYGADENSDSGLSLTFGKGVEIPQSYEDKTLVVSWTELEDNIVNSTYNYWNDYTTYTSYDTADVVNEIMPKSTAYWFYDSYAEKNNKDLSSIQNIENLNTSLTTDMSYMFAYCLGFTEFDLSSLNTSSVTSMSSMFYNCDGIRELNLSSFDTSNVTDMNSMFSYCDKLWYIDLSNFDTSKVTNMGAMFCGSFQIKELNLSSFDTSNVTNMRMMFNGVYYYLKELDLSNFDTSNVTDMSSMFKELHVNKLDISSFDTSNVTNMSYMFSDLYLTELDLSHLNTSNVTDMSYMFKDCRYLTSLNISSFDASKVTDMRYMFQRCAKLTKLDLSSFDTSNVTNMTSMFDMSGNSGIKKGVLKTIYVSDTWNTSKVTSSSSMFYLCNDIVGGNGTTYNSSKTDKTYARIDTPETPGYLTLKEETPVETASIPSQTPAPIAILETEEEPLDPQDITPKDPIKKEDSEDIDDGNNKVYAKEEDIHEPLAIVQAETEQHPDKDTDTTYRFTPENDAKEVIKDKSGTVLGYTLEDEQGNKNDLYLVSEAEILEMQKDDGITMYASELIEINGDTYQRIYVKEYPSQQLLLKVDENTNIDLPSIENVTVESYVELGSE